MTEPPRILLVTGGSRGIGAAIARKAAKGGFDVAINYMSDLRAAEAVADDVRAAGRRAVTIKGDVALDADVLSIFQTIDSTLGRLTHLVNNAGITGKSSRLEAASAAVIRQCIDVNVTGAILVAQAAIGRMSTRHGGSGGVIVNISSVAATLGSAGDYVWYAASKGAIDSLTLGLARELAADGIRVNAVSPGLIDTEIHEKSSHDATRVERYRPMIPMARIGTSDEIADAVLYLLSDAASYVTGANLRVAGGR
jgi:NAD(P)-dependent dehydrogenase (short-subunit alcohol dehydrogenase family)